ncbi:amidohydrolase [Streptomyces sp. NPDC046821]|uniref:amidohydrolase n=1 Tax=Streptomyces sp. NPDC046821 TaxID=3154702 RepID=UPI003403F9FF
MTPPPLSRRGVLAGAALLGATTTLGTAGAAQAAAAPAAGGKAPRKPVVFRNIRPFAAAEAVDLTVIDGIVAAGPAPKGAKVIDGGGRIALPALVDAHIHPDKTSWGGSWVSRKPARTIADFTEQDVELFKAQKRPVAERAYGLMAHAVTRGTRAMRAHADVAPAFGLAGVEGIAEARERLADALDVQIVAFPQHGVVRTPGTAKLLEDAARAGLIDMVGGIDPISFDNALDEQLDLVFDLADKYDVGVDIHLHDRDERGTRVLRGIIDRTKALSLRGKVTVSHVFCLPYMSKGDLETMAADLAAQDIALTTVAPGENTVLPIATLQKHGVRVGLGSDGVRDSWSPFGNADMFHRAHILGQITDVRLDEELTACYTVGANGSADVMGLPHVDFKPGSPADFVLLKGECVPQIVVDLPQRDMVVHGGQVVARAGELV